MIVDKMVFSDAQLITPSAAFASTDVIDTEVAGSNIGGGTPLWLICRINTAPTGYSGTFVAALQNATASGGTFVNIVVSPTHTAGHLVKGFDVLTIPLPVDNLRYLRMYYTPATGTGASAGNIDALLSLNAPKN